MRHRNGLFMNGSGRWETREQLRANTRRAKPFELMGSGEEFGDTPVQYSRANLPTPGYFQATVVGKGRNPVHSVSRSPRDDLHELVLWSLQKAAQAGGTATIINHLGKEMLSVERDPKSKRWMVRNLCSCAMTEVALRRLQRDRVLLRDIENPRIFWVTK